MVSTNIMKELYPDYGKIHHWLAKNYGKASKCEHCKGSDKKYEWALLKGKTYEKNIDNFFQLCTSCHRKYDMNDNKRNAFRLHVLSQPIHNRCKTVYRIDPLTGEEKKYISVRSAAAEFNVHHTAIVFAIKKNGKSKGFYWRYEGVE